MRLSVYVGLRTLGRLAVGWARAARSECRSDAFALVVALTGQTVKRTAVHFSFCASRFYGVSSRTRSRLGGRRARRVARQTNKRLTRNVRSMPRGDTKPTSALRYPSLPAPLHSLLHTRSRTQSVTSVTSQSARLMHRHIPTQAHGTRRSGVLAGRARQSHTHCPMKP